MSKVQAPLFTESAIHLAHICALETWHGYNYSNGKQFNEVISVPNQGTKGGSIKIVTCSDEYFLNCLSTQLFAIIKPKDFKSTLPINESFLDAFRRVAGIKQSERRGPKPYYAGGLAFIKKYIANDYKQYQKISNVADKRLEAHKYAQNLSIAFTEQNSPDIPASEHVMLATRLLFFTMPNCLIFNYSPVIAKGLSLKGIAEIDIAEYQEKLADGLNANWATLCKFDMPLPKNLHPYIYDVAKKSGWWQRRIFDLALKNNYAKGVSFKVSERVKLSFFNKPQQIC